MAARGYPALAQLRARFLVLKVLLAPQCPPLCLPARAPRVRMPPRGSLAQSMLQLFLALAPARVGGYPPAVRRGLLFQRPARPGQLRPGQLRRRRKITRPH